MTDQAPDDGPVTFINVIEIPEEEIETFVEQWKQRSRLTTTAEGFISAELHRAVGDARFQVINVTRWLSRAHFEAATGAAEFRSELDTYASAPTTTWTANRGFYRVAVAL